MSGKTSTPAVNRKGMHPIPVAHDRKLRQDEAIRATMEGVGCRRMYEPVPNYIKAEVEKVISNNAGASIVLGKDRPADRWSGHGGKGETHCASIDLVVGRAGYKGKPWGVGMETPSMPADDLYVDPLFLLDAARIHISQATDIDQNFGLASGRVGNSRARSGIGIKADAVRIIAREGIKLVTRTDARNSRGGKVSACLGIDLIAGNSDGNDEHGQPRLQPIPKGDNLSTALELLAKNVSQLNAIVFDFIQSQMEYNIAVQNHVHQSPFLGIPTTPSMMLIPAGLSNTKSLATRTIADNIKNKVNLQGFVNNFLKANGPNYINSRWNHTT